MNKLIKRFAAAFTAVAVTATAGIFTASAENVTYLKGSDTDDLVDIMQNYCFIALDELDVRGHQHGSAIADRIVRNPTPVEGTSVESELCLRDKYGATTSYIRRFENLVGIIKIGLPKDTLYVGSEYTVEKRGSQNFIKNSFGGNEHIVDNAGTVIADTDTVKYMDIDNLQRSFIAYNKQLAKSTETGEVTLSGQKLSVSAMSGVVYYNINSTNYNDINPDATIDFPANSTAILVLNIDMDGITNWQGVTDWNRKPLVLTEGGQEVPCGEEVINHQTANRIYYNFYDSSKTDLQYTGTISMTDKGWGTIIAPSAALTVGTNFCGVLIASSVTATGETHFVGAYNPVTPIAESGESTINPSDCKTEIEFDKVDGTNGCALEGALFGIYSDSACTNELFRATSDSSGIVRFKDIPAGTYYLKEIEPPTGFKKNETIYTAYVEFDNNGNGSVTFGENRQVKLTVPNDPVSAAVSSTTEPQPVPTPSESTLNTTVPSESNSSTTTTTTAESDGSSGTTSYKWTTPSYNRPVTTTTTVPTATTTKRDGSANVTTAGQGSSKTDSTKKTTKSDKDNEAVTTKKTTKSDKDNEAVTEKTTRTDKNGEVVTDSTDKTTVSGEETTPVTSKTNKTDTTRPPEETNAANGEVDADKDVVTDKKSDKTNDKSDNDSNSAVTTDGSDDELELIVVTSGHDNSTGVDLSTETDSTNSENPYTGVESAAGIAIFFGELALAVAILKKK